MPHGPARRRSVWPTDSSRRPGDPTEWPCPGTALVKYTLSMTPEDDARLQDVWQRDIGCEQGPLPGARLNAMTTPHGWCGRVHDVDPTLATQAAEAIATAYQLPVSSVIVRKTDQTSLFVWCYAHPSGADYHRGWPQPVIDGSEYIDVRPSTSGASLLDFVRLTEMANKYRGDWRSLRGDHPVQIDRFLRRTTMLRAGILDILARTSPAAVRELLLRVGVVAESLPTDLLLALDYPVSAMRTLPKVVAVHLPTRGKV